MTPNLYVPDEIKVNMPKEQLVLVRAPHSRRRCRCGGHIAEHAPGQVYNQQKEMTDFVELCINQRKGQLQQ